LVGAFQNKPGDAIFWDSLIKVDQKEVGFVNRKDSFHRFDFNDTRIFSRPLAIFV